MLHQRFVGAVLFLAFSVGSAFAGNTAGVFRLAFNPNQTTWYNTSCSSMGFTDKNPSGQIFMELNTDLKPAKYHPAEDWNGVCGGESDKGANLYAIADATVQDATMGGGPTSADSGGWLLLRLSLPDVSSRYILYEHILDIANNPRTGQKFKAGDAVQKDDVVAHIGNGNGAWQYHLHLEMRRDNSIPLTANPYQTPLTVANALKYTSPSLFIDDRSNAVVQNLVQNQWTMFMQRDNAPSSTTFVEYNGERYSLQRAVQLGYIYQYIYEQRSGTWYYYPDITTVFFGSGNTYAVWSFVGGAVLNVLVPGDRFRDDRAKIDMLHRAASDFRFSNIRTEVPYAGSNLSWDPAWELRWVGFDFNSTVLNMYHATYKTNPLIRSVTFFDPATGQWSVWIQMNVNALD